MLCVKCPELMHAVRCCVLHVHSWRGEPLVHKQQRSWLCCSPQMRRPRLMREARRAKWARPAMAAARPSQNSWRRSRPRPHQRPRALHRRTTGGCR